jgi:translation initiation factor 1A
MLIYMYHAFECRLEFFRGRVRPLCAFSQNYSDKNWQKSKGVKKMGKRKITNEGSLDSMVLPSTNDVLGVAVKMLGAERITVKCQDGKERMCRVRGKLKRRVWIREGDIVLVSPWDFQSDTRGDIFWRYRKNQSDWLRSHNYLTM